MLSFLWSAGQALLGIGVGAGLIQLAYKWFFSPRFAFPLKDKVVLVTGASSGLGKALAAAFLVRGARVILASRSIDKLRQICAELESENPNAPKPESQYLDLGGDPASIGDVAKSVIDIHGHIDVLVNNAGMSYRGAIGDTAMHVHRHLMEVNYFGQVALTTALLPSLRQTPSGSAYIVGVSSIQGKIGIPFRSAYSASKHAFQAFFDTLRAEESVQGIHVLVASPAYIQTNLSRSAMTAEGTAHGHMDETTASGMTPEAVANEIVDAVAGGEQELTWKYEAVILRHIFPSAFFKIMNTRALKGTGRPKSD